MIQSNLQNAGYRWTKPTWERAGDRTWVLIVPSQYSKTEETESTSDPDTDRSQRFYEVFEFDGTWLDQLHEMQLEGVLQSPRWRRDLNLATA